MSGTKNQKPKDIKSDELITDICCHPSKDVVVSGEINGQVKLHSYSVEGENHLLLTLPHHKRSCRCVKFSRDGDILYTASKDKSVCTVDLNTGALIHSHHKAHNCAIYSMCLAGDNLLATGDDDGHLKLWDTRTHTAIMEEKTTEEYISGMDVDSDARILLATSGDGTLTAYNLRKRRMQLQSETCNSEMLSVAIMKHRTKVVCGSGNKAVNIFSWGEWSNMSDRFPGFKGSVDCVTPLSEEVLCTGSSDGAIRVVNILPNRFLGVVGRHDGFPVEQISLTHDKNFVASCSHDQAVKFWDLSSVSNQDIKANEKPDRRQKNKNLNARKEDDFFFDLKNDEAAKASAADAAAEPDEGSTNADVDDAGDDVRDDDDDSDVGDDSDDEGGSDGGDEVSGGSEVDVLEDNGVRSHNGSADKVDESGDNCNSTAKES